MSDAEHMPGNTDETFSPALLHLINGFRISQLIAVAAKLGLADLLAAGPQSSAALAEHTGMHAPSLYRVLRALSSIGVFHEDEHGRFGLTPLADGLRSDVPSSLRAWAIFCGDPQVWQAWGALGYSVQTGETAFSHVFGMDVWTYRAQHPEANAIFNAAMAATSAREVPAIVAAYDFSRIHTLVDVGGGHGTLLAGILQVYPSMRGVLFDLPHVLAGAAPVLEAAGVAERCQRVGGSFFDSVPPGGDAYLLHRIIHDWDDEQSTAILQRCHAAMAAQARLLLVEGVIQPPNRPDPTKMLDIQMLVSAGGRERTESEWRTLLARAGFGLTQVYSTSGRSSILEGVPIYSPMTWSVGGGS